jgi:Holliday junction resolvase RusA-like endonuclease
MTITLVIPGKPIGKQRARVVRTRQGKVMSFTPGKTRNQEATIRAIFADKYPGFEPLEGPVEMEVLVLFAIPKSASKKRATEMRCQRELPTKKPDASNVAKLAEDALNGIAYQDDSQIVYLVVLKQYSNIPHMEIKVRPFGEEP